MQKQKKRSKRELSILPGAAVGVKVISKTIKDKDGKLKVVSDINLALKKFKKEVKASGKLLELKDRSYFVSKKDKARKQKERAVFFQQINSREEQW